MEVGRLLGFGAITKVQASEAHRGEISLAFLVGKIGMSLDYLRQSLI